ncbi:succinylglutamate desuccinylase/aspartoacylase family protein [Ahrensia marina]|uniref:succinylglutamate desuccinylase/aspartoacylase family protein n=1 Tax=Ahrensia marina TaxID=1514904 RepID=UPI0035CF0964
METLALSFDDGADALFDPSGSSSMVHVGSELTFVTRATSNGPIVLLVGGTHGDEFEGQLAVGAFARALSTQHLTGTVICMPRHNRRACSAARRCTPETDIDLNRAYAPGAPGYAPVAQWIDENLLGRVDWVIDLHSGGNAFDFLPSANVQATIGSSEDLSMRPALQAFGAPFAIVFDEVNGDQMPHTGTLEAAARRKNVKAISSELGGAGRVTPQTMTIAYRAVTRLLQHIGCLAGEDALETATTPPTRLLRLDKPEHYVWPPHAGLLEPRVDLGEAVERGATIATIHHRDPMETPTPLHAPIAGVLAAWQASCAFDPDQPVAMICEPL